MLVGSRKGYALETNVKIIQVDCVQMEEYMLWKRFLRRFSSMNNQYVAVVPSHIRPKLKTESKESLDQAAGTEKLPPILG